MKQLRRRETFGWLGHMHQEKKWEGGGKRKIIIYIYVYRDLLRVGLG